MLESDGKIRFAKTGTTYRNSYVFVAKVMNERIVDLREYTDTAYSMGTLRLQLPPETLAILGRFIPSNEPS